MEIIADLHLHSKYSRAVSPQMNIAEMVKWAKIKGINLLGTGDFTHPLWLSGLRTNMEEMEGILELKDYPPSSLCKLGTTVGARKEQEDRKVKFLLTTEISSIYSQGGKTRKIHNLIIAPSFEIVEKICHELRLRGCNLLSDGRPIVGLSARNLLELILSVDENCLFIPCHIWTPWFSLYGANSGFDSIEECFGELSKYIYAVETGLSSDPQMNWQVPDLDNRQIVSFSDAHSPANLGREATVFDVGDKKIWGYEDIRRAILGEGEKWDMSLTSHSHILYTVEFYPEEGKYHYTGHRNCGVVQSPEETKKKGTTCPVCGKHLTVGVMHRVMQLASHEVQSSSRQRRDKVQRDDHGVRWTEKEGRPPYVALVPLREIIAEVKGIGKLAKGVEVEYQNLVERFGNELQILLKTKVEEIAKVSGEKLAEGIVKVRSGDIYINPGFDGEYGTVRIWGEKEEGGEKKEQMSLF